MALSLFQLCIVFTVGLLLGSASVWGGGGPGPPQGVAGGARAILRGSALRLPCSAPDPRSAQRSKLKHSNMLEIGSPHKISIDDDEADSPLDLSKDEDFYYGTNDNDSSKAGEEKELSSDFELGDDDSVIYDDEPRRRNNDKYRKKQREREYNNGKLERKQLDTGRKRKLRLKPEIKDDDDYEENNYREQTSPVSYIWFHNGTEIKSNESRRYVLPDGTLFFKKFGSRKGQKNGLQDVGEYRCVAQSSSGAILSTMLNLSYANIDHDFLRYPVDVDVNEGDAVQFSCNIKSNPPAKIFWMKESKLLIPNGRIYHLSANSLLIKNISSDDMGKYRCIAKNNIVNKTRLSPEAIVTVLKPQQSFLPISFVADEFESYNESQMSEIKNISVYYEDDVYLSCAVNGKPKPKVIWNYQADASSMELKEISSMEVLKLQKISEDKSGFYTCVANNLQQTIKQTYHVSVRRAPYLSQYPTSEHTPTAKTVRFNCSAGGSPPPTLVWYRDGHLLNITGRVMLKAQDNKPPELIISDTITSDRGIYQCVAGNSEGEATAWASLTVQTQNVPPPNHVTCKPIAADAIRITWSAPKDPVVAYTLHFVLADGGEERSQILTAEKFDLKKLEMYRKYDIYIKAYNTHGASDQSHHVICHGQGVRIYLSSIPNNSIHIAWKKSWEYVKSWMVEWRTTNRSNTHIHNVTLPGSSDSYIVPDAYPLDKYEFRVLASPTEEWLAQDTELIPWTSARNRTIIQYKETFSFNNQSHSEEFDASSPRIQDVDNVDWMGQEYPRPTNVVAKALGPHSINITWSCEAAETSSDAYIFEICYSPSNYAISSMKTLQLEHRNESCQSSYYTWTLLRGLEPATYYAIKVQAVMQNKPIVGPFSETVVCRTKRDEKSSISDVRWKKISNNQLQISWSHNLNNMLDYDDSVIELSEDGNDFNHKSIKRSWSYTVRYTQDLSYPVDKWPSLNVTDDTSVEINNLDPSKGCFIMVFVAGENKGSPLEISDKEMMMTPVAPVAAKQFDRQQTVILGLLALLLVIVIVSMIVLWSKRKNRQDQEGQMRSRAGKSDFECQELMTQPPYVDSKFLGRKHMGNGNCRPLLGKKSLGPVFDVSRYEELPDVTETVLEADVSDSITPEVTSDSTQPISTTNTNNSKGDTVHGSHFTIDRNSNSEVTNIRFHNNESLGNENVTISDKSYLNKIPGANSMGEKEGVRCKSKCSVEASALSGYRENGRSCRVAPVVGPNG